MSDLIERLEKATGPDRILDDAIWTAIGHKGGFSAQFTGSIDAALTLVPRGAIWKVFNDWPGEFHWAEVQTTDWLPNGEPNILRSRACESPAIALCIAALKAQAAE